MSSNKQYRFIPQGPLGMGGARLANLFDRSPDEVAAATVRTHETNSVVAPRTEIKGERPAAEDHFRFG